MLDSALTHYRAGIRYDEMQGNRFRAGSTRWNVAFDLTQAGRFDDAQQWAGAALRDFEASENADEEIIKTTQLLTRIESALSETSQPQ